MNLGVSNKVCWLIQDTSYWEQLRSYSEIIFRGSHLQANICQSASGLTYKAQVDSTSKSFRFTKFRTVTKSQSLQNPLIHLIATIYLVERWEIPTRQLNLQTLLLDFSGISRILYRRCFHGVDTPNQNIVLFNFLRGIVRCENVQLVTNVRVKNNLSLFESLKCVSK